MKSKTLVIGSLTVTSVVLGIGAFYLATQLTKNRDNVQNSTADIVLEQITDTTENNVQTTVTEPVTEAELTTETEQVTAVEQITSPATEAGNKATSAESANTETAAQEIVQQQEIQQPVADDPQTVAMRSYAGVLRNFMNGNEYSDSSRYDLFDVTNDGIPELFLSVRDYSQADYRKGTVKIYTYRDGRSYELTSAIVNDGGWNGRMEEAYMIGVDGVLYLRPGSGFMKSHDTSYSPGNSPGFCDEYFEYQNDGYIHWAANLMYDTMSGYAMAAGTAGAGISADEYETYKREYEGNGSLVAVGRQFYFPQSADDWSYVGDYYLG